MENIDEKIVRTIENAVISGVQTDDISVLALSEIDDTVEIVSHDGAHQDEISQDAVDVANSPDSLVDQDYVLEVDDIITITPQDSVTSSERSYRSFDQFSANELSELDVVTLEQDIANILVSVVREHANISDTFVPEGALGEVDTTYNYDTANVIIDVPLFAEGAIDRVFGDSTDSLVVSGLDLTPIPIFMLLSLDELFPEEDEGDIFEPAPDLGGGPGLEIFVPEEGPPPVEFFFF